MSSIHNSYHEISVDPREEEIEEISWDIQKQGFPRIQGRIPALVTLRIKLIFHFFLR